MDRQTLKQGQIVKLIYGERIVLISEDESKNFIAKGIVLQGDININNKEDVVGGFILIPATHYSVVSNINETNILTDFEINKRFIDFTNEKIKGYQYFVEQLKKRYAE